MASQGSSSPASTHTGPGFSSKPAPFLAPGQHSAPLLNTSLSAPMPGFHTPSSLPGAPGLPGRPGLPGTPGLPARPKTTLFVPKTFSTSSTDPGAPPPPSARELSPPSHLGKRRDRDGVSLTSDSHSSQPDKRTQPSAESPPSFLPKPFTPPPALHSAPQTPSGGGFMRPVSSTSSNTLSSMPSAPPRAPEPEKLTSEQQKQRIESHFGGFSSSPLAKMRPTERQKNAFPAIEAQLSTPLPDHADLQDHVYHQALSTSLAEAKNPRPAQEAHFTAGYVNETIETHRLQQTGFPVVSAQTKVPVTIDDTHLKPRSFEKVGGKRTFIPDLTTPDSHLDIKTGRSLASSRDQLVGLAKTGNLDIVAATSSANLDVATLQEVNDTARAHGTRLRMRSNSMNEGQFINYGQMRTRQALRTQHPDLFKDYPT